MPIMPRIFTPNSMMSWGQYPVPTVTNPRVDRADLNKYEYIRNLNYINIKY